MLSTSKNNLQRFIKFFIENKVLILLLTIAAFLRFYNTPNRYNFGADSARDALVAIYGSSTFQLPLIGPFSSVGPFTFGPWYYYQLIFFQRLFPTTYSPWIYMGFSSLVTIFIIYKIGKSIIGKEFGLFLAAIITVSPAFIQSSMGLTNPNLIPLFASLVILMFCNLAKEKSSLWYGFLLGLFLGIGISIHYQMLGMLLILPIGLILNPRKYRHYILAFGGILIASLPTLFYEVNNNWTTVRNFTESYIHMKERIYVPNRWLTYVGKFWPEFWSYILGLPIISGVIIMLLAVLASLYASITQKKTALTALLIFFILSFISLRYYPGERSYGYLQFYYPLIVIFTGYLFYRFSRIKLGNTFLVIAVCILAGFSLRANIAMTKNDASNDLFKKQSQIIMRNTENTPVVLYTCSKDLYEYRVQSIAIQLYYDKKLSLKGKKIVFLSTKCKNYKKFSKVLHPLRNIDAVYAQNDASLLRNQYRVVTPEAVYKSTVEWYKNPQN